MFCTKETERHQPRKAVALWGCGVWGPSLPLSCVCLRWRWCRNFHFKSQLNSYVRAQARGTASHSCVVPGFSVVFIWGLFHVGGAEPKNNPQFIPGWYRCLTAELCWKVNETEEKKKTLFTGLFRLTLVVAESFRMSHKVP